MLSEYTMDVCKTAEIKTTYISASCNRTTQCCDWGQNGLICFGCCHAVAIYKPKNPAIITVTLVGHKDRVNCVKWIRKGNHEPETEMVSASHDKTAILWKQTTDSFTPAVRLEGHTGPVTVVDAIYSKTEEDRGERLLIATASTDSTVKIWERKSGQDDCVCKQTISRGQSLTLTLAWVILPDCSVPLLACAFDDLSIRLFVEISDQFLEVQVLAGHEEWIRGLDFTVDDNGDVLLASCSHDTYIRLWRISKVVSDVYPREHVELKVKEKLFQVHNSDQSVSYVYRVSLDSVLLGHDNWVLSARWQPSIITDGVRHQPMCLLSSSMDKTLIVWQPNTTSGIWTEQSRVGEIGGSNLGFFGGLLSPDGKHILAHGFHGSFHLWRSFQDSWEPEVTCGGHFGPVQDIAWNNAGEYLVSVSSDQTSRLHGYWAAEDEVERSWHELARPQIHGYDMQCLAMFNRFSFASGADEKVVRIFRAPKNFLENFKNLTKSDVEDELKKLEASHVAEGASVPALGLSNKAVYADETKTSGKDGRGDAQDNGQYSESYFTPQILTAPPTEESLLQNTLWPEEQKLYGHGYEVFALASHPDGSILASSCKASKPEHAAIILWDTATWRLLDKLESHSLTVTQLQFSHSGEFLLSVSRDRTWSLFQKTSSSDSRPETSYSRVAFSDKKTSIHSRIIWSCAWSADDKYFITVSRDKKGIIWGRNELPCSGSNSSSCLGNYSACSHPVELDESITAVDFAPTVLRDGRYLVAFGLECGFIALYSWSPELKQSKDSWIALYALTQSMAHHLTVKRLKFRPRSTPNDAVVLKDNVALELASCADDNAVKIYKLFIS